MSKAIRRLSALIHALIPLLAVFTACSALPNARLISGVQMAEANRLYEDGRYAEASAHYQALVDAGVNDGSLFYNLGDAYFKKGDIGRAVLNFRRAERLLPRDADVAANLDLARAQAIDRIAIESEGAVIRLARRLISWTTLDEAAAAALLAWITLCGLLIGAILWQSKRRITLVAAAAVAVLLLLGVISVAARSLDERGRPSAVIVADEVAVHSGPGEDYLAEFTLHAGAEVRVVDHRATWTRIALPGDLQGWVPSHTVINVMPNED